MNSESFEPETVSWLWPDLVAYGYFSIIQGKPGIGKTAFISALAARVTNHCDGRVLIMASETHPPDRWINRLDAANADKSKIWFHDNDRPIWENVKKVGASLLIIDPISTLKRFNDAIVIARTENIAVVGTTTKKPPSDDYDIHMLVRDTRVNMPGRLYAFRAGVEHSRIGQKTTGPSFDINNNGAAEFLHPCPA